eukprot:gene25044-biopygen11964
MTLPDRTITEQWRPGAGACTVCAGPAGMALPGRPARPGLPGQPGRPGPDGRGGPLPPVVLLRPRGPRRASGRAGRGAPVFTAVRPGWPKNARRASRASSHIF